MLFIESDINIVRDDTENNNETNNETNSNIYTNTEINVNIYRYKFTNNFTDELYKFSKIHQYDHRTDFKLSWNNWIEENDDIVCEEVRRLTNLGYDGDILDKMFKSARYYFRKKSTEKKTPQKRRTYIGAQQELLDSMDKHIEINIRNKEYKPADGFDSYCSENIELLKEEVNRLVQTGLKDANEIKNKFKKTYKNRYFLFIK